MRISRSILTTVVAVPSIGLGISLGAIVANANGFDEKSASSQTFVHLAANQIKTSAASDAKTGPKSQNAGKMVANQVPLATGRPGNVQGMRPQMGQGRAMPRQPGMMMPNMQMPRMQSPNMQMQMPNMPNMRMPQMQTPNMRMPNMPVPNMPAPNFQRPRFGYGTPQKGWRPPAWQQQGLGQWQGQRQEGRRGPNSGPGQYQPMPGYARRPNWMQQGATGPQGPRGRFVQPGQQPSGGPNAGKRHQLPWLQRWLPGNKGTQSSSQQGHPPAGRSGYMRPPHSGWSGQAPGSAYRGNPQGGMMGYPQNSYPRR